MGVSEYPALGGWSNLIYHHCSRAARQTNREIIQATLPMSPKILTPKPRSWLRRQA
jgi:hypothetical protein